MLCARFVDELGGRERAEEADELRHEEDQPHSYVPAPTNDKRSISGACATWILRKRRTAHGMK